MIDGDLGRFLRNRRESVTPAEVGLPTGSRRRTPGLRRAELATLAGISVDYLVRLEQGRDTHPSAQVLAALADALHLDEDDRDHLRMLAAISNGRELCPNGRPLARQVRPSVTGDARCPRAERGVRRQPAWRRAGVEPRLRTHRRTGRRARWRRAQPRPLHVRRSSRRGGVPRLGHGRRRASRQSARRRVAVPTRHSIGSSPSSATLPAWRSPTDGRRQALAPKRSGQIRLVHPDVGALRLASEMLQLPDSDEQHLVVWLAADDATAAALDQLNGRYPGALHAVDQAAS